MSDRNNEKLPRGVAGILAFMFSVLIALVIYWWLHITGTVIFV